MVHIFSQALETEDGKARATDLDRWKTCPNLSALFQLNQDYLAGTLRIHPGHDGAVLENSAGVPDGLLEMNEYGMFTFQGQ